MELLINRFVISVYLIDHQMDKSAGIITVWIICLGACIGV